MRTLGRVGIALLIALALSTPVHAQSSDDRLSVNAAVGPSFASLGTTFSTTAGIDYRLNDRTALVGEFGFLPHAPLGEAAEIAPSVPSAATGSPHVNAYHWNGNLHVRPFTLGRIEPYLTAGMGAFAAETVVSRPLGGTLGSDHRRITDFSTNVGAGLRYRLNDWIGLAADYRTFFVHRDDDTPHVNRFTAGLTFSLR